MQRNPVGLVNDHEQIIAGFEAVFLALIDNSTQALGAVSQDAALCASLDAKAKPRGRQAVGQRPDGQEAPPCPDASPSNREKLFGQAKSFADTKRHPAILAGARGEPDHNVLAVRLTGRLVWD